MAIFGYISQNIFYNPQINSINIHSKLYTQRACMNAPCPGLTQAILLFQKFYLFLVLELCIFSPKTKTTKYINSDILCLQNTHRTIIEKEDKSSFVCYL